MLFFRRTIIPHKKVLQKGREQILFFALALILCRLLPPLTLGELLATRPDLAVYKQPTLSL